MVSLSREEVCLRFGFSSDVLDALLESGHLLCHVSRGEVRIPLVQLETFFRQGLIRAVEAAAGGLDMKPAEPEPRKIVSQPVAIEDAQFAEPPESESDDAGVASFAAAAPAPAGNPPADAPAPPPPRIAPPEVDYRAAPRFVPRRQIDGIFGNMRFTIVQLSRTGLRIRHNDEVLAGTEGKLRFALLNPAARSFVMTARVVWTSIAMGPAGARFYISGVRITEHADQLAGAIDILNAAHDLQPERRKETLPPAAGDAAAADIDAPPVAIADDDLDLVIRAVQHFAANPVDANRWYARGRFATSDAEVRRHAPTKPREREEVLGIWEYLNRQLDVRTVADILTWLQRARDAATTAQP